MALRYQKPPLVEALCELRFASASDEEWDWSIADALHERIREQFPTRRMRFEFEIPVATPALPNAPKIVQFVSEDKTAMVQLGANVLAVNSLQRHLGWPELRDSMLVVLNAYREISSPVALSMAAVRYINRVELPTDQGFSLKRYFSVLPGVPNGVPTAITEFLIHTGVKFDDPPAIFRFRFGSTESEQKEIAAFMVDFEHVTGGDYAPSFDDLNSWLNSGHERIETGFRGCFTIETHKRIFEEIEA